MNSFVLVLPIVMNSFVLVDNLYYLLTLASYIDDDDDDYTNGDVELYRLNGHTRNRADY